MKANYILALALVAVVSNSAMGGKVKRFGPEPNVDKLAAFMLDNIHCEATKTACTVACVASASYYLTPASAGAASYLCPKVCDR